MTNRMFAAVAKGGAALAVVLPLGFAAVIPAPRPTGLFCRDGKPSEAVCQATATGMNHVADISDAIDSAGSPQKPGAPQPGK